MPPFKRKSSPASELTLDKLPWIPKEMEESLVAIVAFLVESFKISVSRIGLYGSWQRGEASSKSDVDLVVFLADEVTWFDADNGIINRSDARKDKLQWHAIISKANTCRQDARIYSIEVVTSGMLEYYSTHGPIHLQNWVDALSNCFLLWER